ncbi:hypothetical protein [Roseibium sp.]|uniref:hypothetical protein n=1 Tax=Roseibium sp. TaxID=1936156 RepID=UPI003A96A6B2
MSYIKRIGLAAIGLSIASAAFAGKLEKVDIVKEGIDQKPIVVRADNNGYTSYASGAHRYYLRVYAKAKGSNAVWFIGLYRASASPWVQKTWFFSDKVRSSDGWSSYSKSLAVDVRPEHSRFYFDPKVVCTENLKKQMKNGMSKSKVLDREWKLTAQARFAVTAVADSKKRNRKNDHTTTSGEKKSREAIYPVNVLCQRAS